MKKLSEIIQESRTKAVPNIGTVSAEKLSKYLEVAQKLISTDAKTVIAYLQKNPSVSDQDLLALAKKKNDNPELAEALKKLQKYDRLKEVPVFQTEDEFNAIMNQDCTVDELLYDFDTERGRNEIAKRYDDMIHKIAHSYVGKSNLDYDELLSAAYNGFTEALNKYGKRERIQTDENGNKKWVSFGIFAQQQIRFYILEDIKNLSHGVSIPTSVQQRERNETGRNTKSFTVSGDDVRPDGRGKGGNNKTYFDLIAADSSAATGLTGAEVDDLWTQLLDRVREVFGPKRSRDIDIFMDSYGIRREEAMKDKDVAKKYGIAASNVTRIKKDIKYFIAHDEECLDICADLCPYYDESLSEFNVGIRVVEG